MTKVELLDLLRNNDQVKMVFTKRDGSERTLIGTLKVGSYPLYVPKTTRQPIEQPNLVRVWEFAVEDFRTITVDQIISVEVL